MQIHPKHILYAIPFIFIASISYAQTNDTITFLTGNSGLTTGLLKAQSFGDLFNVVFNVIVGLASAWAVISLVYWGAKYALVNSVTGKSAAKENLIPVFMGLVALLGTYLIFNQINPNILKLDLYTPKFDKVERQNISVPVEVKDNQGVVIQKPVGGADGETKKDFLEFIQTKVGRVQKFCVDKIGGDRNSSLSDWRKCSEFIDKAAICVLGSDSGKQISENACVYLLNNFDDSITVRTGDTEQNTSLWNLVFENTKYNKDFFQKIREGQRQSTLNTISDR